MVITNHLLDALHKKEMALGGHNSLPSLRPHSWWGHCWYLNTLLALLYNTWFVGVALTIKPLSVPSTLCVQWVSFLYPLSGEKDAGFQV